MNIKERLQILQQRANECAIEETNCREKIEQLEDVKRKADVFRMRKNQIVGAIAILNEQIAEEEAANAAPKSETGILADNSDESKNGTKPEEPATVTNINRKAKTKAA